MLRKLTCAFLASALILVGAAMILGFALQGGRTLVLLGGSTLCGLGVYWIKEDWFEAQ